MNHRQETTDDYQSRILKVQLHLQAHLDQPWTLEELAQLAHFSPYHFHRIFKAFVGETLFQHTRRLRLERSAGWLVNTEYNITDIALRSGYDTPAAFGKAFKQLFGMAPSVFRESRQTVSYHSTQARYGDKTMSKRLPQPTIKDRTDTRVLFIRRTGEYSQSAQAAWGALFAYAFQHQLDVTPPNMIGLSHDNPDITEEEHCRYDACIPVDDSVEGKGEVGVQTIPGGRYAVFLHEGSYDELHLSYQEIYSDWLPKSQEELRDAGCFEVYLNSMADTAPEALKTEIYIPLR